MGYNSERYHSPHHPDRYERVDPEEPHYMRRGGWWVAPLVILVAAAIPVGMVASGMGGPVVDLIVMVFHLVWVLLIPGSVAGIVVGIVRKKWRWVLSWTIMLLVAVAVVFALYLIG